MGMLKEFKEFAMRGNVVDLAIGVVIGGAFGAIVKSLVDQIVMPLIGYATGGIDFSQFKWVLKPADDSDPKHKIAEVAVQYGAFINTILTFLIIAFAVFVVIKILNRFTRQTFGAAAGPTKDQELLAEIRDLLKTKQP